ncbi:choice-of-anchor D domain-containing protein [Actinacidiphila oryziradicis]|uniref:choice-of-anchor D domain-containing protein n=1 Tax=Actinacidiphila oryziradicis TaxID=2571141 RepID=UPI0023F416A5|nr:choice-of-anchor D domain-containing protein [Actinacidiphila oryziradicis]
MRRLRRAVAVGGASALLASAGVLALTATPAAAASTATGGSGASLPYAEVQAENSATNGAAIGPSYTQGQLADEASRRQAVTLQGTGKYVTFTTPVATNSIDFRYSIPDTADGSVYSAPLSLYVNGTKQTNFSLTNAYSWYYGSYPFTNSPGSNPHHFYDEVHRLFSTTYPAGTTFKLQVDSEDTASSYTIDFADFENVGAALPQPSGSVSVTSKGADPSGVADSTSAFNAAISAAGSGGTVWIPPGSFNIPGHIAVNNVTVAGAGMWYSTVTGTAPGFYGNSAPTPSTGVHLQNFAISGNVQERNDGAQVNGIGGAMSNSSVSSVWIEHMKVGAWMDGPMDKLTFSGVRIRDTTADGINFHGGVTNSTVTNSDLRNTGDDGIATWADSSLGADASDTISNNTVQLQILANGIAIYGGHDNTVSGNLVQDTGIAQGGGIHVGQRFNSTPVGTTNITGNTLIRNGSLDPNWQFGVGSLWFDASQGAITGPINVTNMVIQQSPYEAVQWVEGTISGVNLSNVTISGTGTFALQEQTGGAATFNNVTATGVATSSESATSSSAAYNCEGSNFVVTDGGGNSGLTGSFCGPWPAPIYPPYQDSVNVSPSALDFGAVATGATSAAQNVLVNNPTGSAVPVSSITVSGDYAQTSNCGSSIPANGSCTVSVTFTPTASGTRTGTLTVNAGGSNNPVSLTGTGTAPGPVLNANPASLSFAGTVVGSSAAAQAVTISNTGTTSATVSGVSVTGDFSQTNNCSTIAVGASCTVNVTFTPTSGGTRTGSLSVASNANNGPTTVALTGAGIDSTTNLAAGTPTSASSSNGTYVPANLTDADPSTYWESATGFPQWAQVDLGKSYSVGKVVLRLPPSTSWSARTETLSLLGSTDGTNFSTIVGSAGYTFDPAANNNTVTITFNATGARYVRANITANSGWNAGQLSDFAVYPAASGGTSSATLSTSPSSLTFASQTVNTKSTAQTITVSNTGTASASVSGVATTGDFAQSNNCGTSIAAGSSCAVNVTFTPTASGTRTGNLTITSNASNSPTTVALTGTGAPTNTNLAAGKATSASSYTQTYVSSNVTDGNQSTYWESANNALPQWVQVDLGSSNSVSRIVLQLPAGWGARSQTLSVLGSTDNSTFTTLVASASYTFDPTTNNTVTITFPATTRRYLRVNVTANTGWPAGQLSEFQVWNS